MKLRLCACFFGLTLFVACNKKEPEAAEQIVSVAEKAPATEFGEEIIADKPVKAGETGIMLPVGTRMYVTKDNLEVRVELPAGHAFLTADASAKTLPVYATYACGCSQSGGPCTVFYADGLGFGCLQSSCTGSCTGKFTYAGYTVDRIVTTSSKTEFFSLPEVEKMIREICDSEEGNEPYVELMVQGVPFFLVRNENKFLPKASCDCEGTKACTLKTLGIANYKIYYCDGPCNGCELTIS